MIENESEKLAVSVPSILFLWFLGGGFLANTIFVWLYYIHILPEKVLWAVIAGYNIPTVLISYLILVLYE